MQDWSWVTDDELHVPQKWFPSFDFQEFPKRLENTGSDRRVNVFINAPMVHCIHLMPFIYIYMYIET